MEIEGSVTLTVKELDRLKKELTETTKQRDELLRTEKKVKIEAVVEDRSYPGIAQFTPTLDRYGNLVNRLYDGVKYPKVTKIEYVALDEVMQQLRIDATNLVQSDIQTLNNTISKKDEEITKLYKANSEQIKEAKEERSDKIKKLELRIKELEGEEIEKEKDEQIKKMSEQVKQLERSLKEEKDKKWYQKF